MAQIISIEVPGTKISELEETSAVNDDDVLPLVQGDKTKKAPLSQVAQLVKAGLGTAALKNESDFAAPADVASASQASQARDDAQNERIDNVEFGLVSIANGSDKSFATYSEMIAYVPANANVTVRNNDPNPELRGSYIWNGTQYINGYDPLDAAIKYVDDSLLAEDKENLYEPVNNKTALNVNPAGGAIRSSTNVEINVFPIVGGETYSIKTLAAINKSYVVIGVSSVKAPVAGTSTQLVTLSDTTDPLVKTFTTPAGANWGYINVYWQAFAVDIRNGLVISTGLPEKVVKEIQGKKIFDEAAQAEIKKLLKESLFVDDIVMNIINLYSTQNEHPNFFVNRTSATVQTYTTSSLVHFPVQAGKTYYIKSDAFLSNSCVGLVDDFNVVAGSAVSIILLQDHEVGVKKFTVPIDSVYPYALFTTHLSSQTYNVVGHLTIQDSANQANVTSIRGAKLTPLPENLDGRLTTLEDKVDSINSISPLFGLKWAAIGDSITEHNFRTLKNYHDYISEAVGGMTVYNYGISGTAWWERTNVAAQIKADINNGVIESPDIFTVLLGTNDFGIKERTLGDFGDQTIDSIAGAIYLLLYNLIDQFPTKKIAVFTPLPRYNSYGVNGGTPNSHNVTLRQISEMIIQHCLHFGIPYFDLYARSNLNVFDPEGNEYFFTAPLNSTPDGVHPNDRGHMRIANILRPFLEGI